VELNFSKYPCFLQIQLQQPLQNLIIGQALRPAIRGEDCRIEFIVRQVEPGGMRVIKAGKRAFFCPASNVTVISEMTVTSLSFKINF
jgi:hypothetical protein